MSLMFVRFVTMMTVMVFMALFVFLLDFFTTGRFALLLLGVEGRLCQLGHGLLEADFRVTHVSRHVT